jgi:hypothetical protein
LSITTDTRFESLEKLDRSGLYNLILSTLHDNKENGLTAREVAVILYNQGLLRSNERQATAPRLTELVDDGRVVIIGKRFDEISLRNVAVYTIK